MAVPGFAFRWRVYRRFLISTDVFVLCDNENLFDIFYKVNDFLFIFLFIILLSINLYKKTTYLYEKEKENPIL